MLRWGWGWDGDEVGVVSGLKDKYCIVGVGETAYSRHSGRSTRSLGAEAVRKAINEAGLDPTQVNGMLCYHVGDSTSSSRKTASGSPNSHREPQIDRPCQDAQPSATERPLTRGPKTLIPGPRVGFVVERSYPRPSGGFRG